MNLANLAKNDTIIAPATAPGMGAIAVLRISGPLAIKSVQNRFKAFKGKKYLAKQASHSSHFGYLMDNDKIVDEVLLTLFNEGKSYTGEETVEISCHGSTYITQKILELFLKDGLRIADPGEFTMRAYRNGKYDLAQAEAVADLIHSTNQYGAEIALEQMRGGFSNQIEDLRRQLLDFASLIELELDFAEEDVEFADRTQFLQLVADIQKLLSSLIQSFQWGNAIKNGIPVAIVGKPNVGKSTLLNLILNDERAIVSDIAGTTRDVIEDVIKINGLDYRFIDTAGIRETTDYIEGEGIKKTFQKIGQAKIVLHLLDVQELTSENSIDFLQDLFNQQYALFKDKKIVFVLNKTDLLSQETLNTIIKANPNDFDYTLISAKENQGTEKLIEILTEFVKNGLVSTSDIVVTNIRHVQAMEQAQNALTRVTQAMKNQIPSDLIAIDIRSALQSLGSITGHITTDDLLGNIFSKFCIGK
jgi:tRNA modification GTPase